MSSYILIRSIILRFGQSSFLLTSLLVINVNAPLAAAPPANSAAAFMSQVLTNAAKIINNKADPVERRNQFVQLFHEDFDVLGIARFVSGRFWRTASQGDQQEFLSLFDDYVVFVYTARLGDFGAGTFTILGSRSDDDGAIVSTAVSSPGITSPLKIDWRLVAHSGAYKISDVIVEGISMSVTQRSEFASVIQRNGGQLHSLIALMREKTASAASTRASTSPTVRSRE
jgi:phospholipid transport system substrate-binding protein